MEKISNDIRRFKNKTGQMFFLTEIGRRISGDEEAEILFSEAEIDACPMLANKILSGDFKEIKETDVNEFKKDSEGKEGDGLGGNAVKQESLVGKETRDNEIDICSFGDADESESKEESDKKDKVTKKIDVWWCGPVQDNGGYGKMNRKCVEGLYNKGSNVELDLFQIPDFRASFPITPEIKQMTENTVSEKSPSVWAIMPPRFLPRAGKKILFTMMESAGVCKTFIDKCNNADELWLPSQFNVDIFKEANVKPHIVHIPLGVDIDLFKPKKITKAERDQFKLKTKSFTFFSLFGWSLRKGADILLKSYLQEFTKDDDVSLIIASRLFGSTSVDNIKKIRESIKDYINHWCKDPKKSPHIVHIGQSIPEDKLPILYNMSDCFVLPTRGEGFCLPAAEAGSCELPVICTRCCGQMDFLNDENSYLIDTAGYEKGSQEIEEISSYYQGMPFAVLGDDSVKQLREYMRHIMDHKSEAKKKAKNLRKLIVKKFQWKNTVDKIYERLSS